MGSVLRRLSAAVLALVVAGCDEAPSVQPLGIRSPATASSMVHATAEGPMLVEVAGQPFAVPPPDFAAHVAAAMSRGITGREVGFTADAAAAPRPDFRAVAVFAPERVVAAEAACAGGLNPTGAGPGDDLHLLLVFCHRERELAAVTGRLPAPGGADDPRLRKLLERATRELFREEA